MNALECEAVAGDETEANEARLEHLRELVVERLCEALEPGAERPQAALVSAAIRLLERSGALAPPAPEPDAEAPAEPAPAAAFEPDEFD